MMSNIDLVQYLERIEQAPSYNSYVALASVLDNIKAEESDLPPKRVAVLRNFTFESLLVILKGEIVRMGFFPCIYLGDYDNIAFDVMNPNSDFYRFSPDLILLAQWLETLAPDLVRRFISLSPDEVKIHVDQLLDNTMDILRNIRKRCKAPILLNNFPMPFPVTLGILDFQSDNKQVNTIRYINHELLRRKKELSDIYIIDFDYLMGQVGYQQGFDERYWHIGKAPFSRHALLPVGFEYVRFLRALSGKSYKCLILDCDNTLWGGIVGEDGLEGIQLGPTYPGSCYMAFQYEIKNLHDRGVILVLCSKNNEEDVLEVLEKHPHMLLRKEHFAMWQINWKNKADNIKNIARELNIGTESIVFVDDSEYEIGLVKSQLPQVTALQLPSEPSLFRSVLSKQGYFDSLSFSLEDRKRNQMYRDGSRRRNIRTKASSIEEYLEELNIHVQIGMPDSFNIPRVAQLIQKTNQFNLTTKRYTEGDIINFMNDPGWRVWCLRLKDRISDMGVVGVAIINYCESIAEIDSFLLSCRALGRGAEDALLSYIIDQVQSKGFDILRGYYFPTHKNSQTADFYFSRGFKSISTKDGGSQWEMMVKGLDHQAPKWIRISEGGEEDKCSLEK